MRTRDVPLRTLLLSAVVLAAGPLKAQTAPWLDRGLDRAFWADAMHPSYTQSEGFSAYLFALGARLPVGQGLRAVVEVPLATSSSPFGVEEGFLLGNPYIGIDVGSPTQGPRGSLGVRLPLLSESAPANTSMAAIIGDFERFEAYTPKMLTVQGDLARRWRQPSGIVTEFGVTPTMLKPDQGDPELLAGYRVGVGIDGGRFEGMLWLSGRWWVTAENASFGEATVFQLTAAATLKANRFRPTLIVRLPLDDDLKQVLNTVIGVGVTVGL